MAADVEEQVAVLHRFNVFWVQVHGDDDDVLARLFSSVLERRHHAGRRAAVGRPDALNVGMALIERFKDGLRRVAHEIAVQFAGDDDFRMRVQRVFETLASINGDRRSRRAVDHADNFLAVGVCGQGGE